MEKFWKDFKTLFRQFGQVCARDNKRASIATYHLRQRRLALGFRRMLKGELLRLDGSRQPAFKLSSPYALKPKHIKALILDCEARNVSVAMLHNYSSTLRVFCRWIGKPALVPPTAALVTDPRYRRRSQVAKRNKSWISAGIDSRAVLRKMAETEPHAAMTLELMDAFGLRLREASLMCPHLADRGMFLDVSRGTKGRRPRIIEITTDSERDVLARAKKIVSDPLASLIPDRNGSTRKFKSWSNHIYYLMRKNGITLKTVGTSTHGLRHQRLQREYTRVTGALSPVQGGKPGCVDATTDRMARTKVAALAGHSRRSISSAYLGQFLKASKSNKSWS